MKNLCLLSLLCMALVTGCTSAKTSSETKEFHTEKAAAEEETFFFDGTYDGQKGVYYNVGEVPQFNGLDELAAYYSEENQGAPLPYSVTYDKEKYELKCITVTFGHNYSFVEKKSGTPVLCKVYENNDDTGYGKYLAENKFFSVEKVETSRGTIEAVIGRAPGRSDVYEMAYIDENNFEVYFTAEPSDKDELIGYFNDIEITKCG